MIGAARTPHRSLAACSSTHPEALREIERWPKRLRQNCWGRHRRTLIEPRSNKDTFESPLRGLDNVIRRPMSAALMLAYAGKHRYRGG
jgi:hypothetical protein